MKKALIFLLLLSRSFLAQPPDKFYHKYGGDGIDAGYSVKETYNKQYIIIGSTTSFNVFGTDAYLLLIDSMGVTVWQKTFGGIGNDLGKSIIINPADSGFIFTGFTSSMGNGGYDIYVVRTDKRGVPIWERAYGGVDWDFGSDLCFAPDGNVVVCGRTTDFGTGRGKWDGCVLKVNVSNGDLLWYRVYGGNENDEFLKVLSTSDGLFTLFGNTESFGDIKGDFWFAKLTLGGDSVLMNNIGDQNRKEVFYDFIEDKHGDLVACGSKDTSNVANKTKNISYLIKTSLGGNKIIDGKIPFGTDDNEKCFSLTTAAYGDDYHFSRTYSNGGYGIDIQPSICNYTFYCYNATTYGDFGTDEAHDIISTKDTGFVMVGFTSGSAPTFEDIALVKVKLKDIIIPAPPIVDIPVLLSDRQTNIFYNQGKIRLSNRKLSEEPYAIYDNLGQQVQKGMISDGAVDVERSLPKGIYFFVLLNDPKFSLNFLKIE